MPVKIFSGCHGNNNNKTDGNKIGKVLIINLNDRCDETIPKPMQIHALFK